MTSTVDVVSFAPPSSNHLNVLFPFEERLSTTPVPTANASHSRISGPSASSADRISPRPSNAKHAPSPLQVPRRPQLARPSTAPGLTERASDGYLDYRIPSPTRPYAVGPASPTTLTQSGKSGSGARSKNRHTRRPSTAPDTSRQPSGELLRARPTLAVHPPSAYQSNDVAPMHHIHLPFQTLDDRAGVAYGHVTSPPSSGLQDVLSPLSTDTYPSTPRPTHSRRMSSLSVGGGGQYHSSSSGSSMDFKKFMPQSSTASPKSPSFPNSPNKTPSPIDVKRLLAKPASPLGNHALATQSTPSNVILPSSTASPPPPGATAPVNSTSATPLGEQHVPIDLSQGRTRQSVAIRPSTATAGSSAKPGIQSLDLPRRPTTSASAYVREKDPPQLRTYTSDGEGIGESPLPKRKRYFSTTRSTSQPPSPSPLMKDAPPAEPRAVRLPKISSAMTPAAAYAMAYRTRTSGVESEHRPADLSVSPWLQAEGHQHPVPPGDDGAPSEWDNFCSPRGFRRLRRKMSTKLNVGDRTAPAEARALEVERPRKRSVSADPVRQRAPDATRKASGDSKATSASKAASSADPVRQRAPDATRKTAGDSKGTTASKPVVPPRPSTEKLAEILFPATPATLPRSSRVEHKKRPSTGEQIWGIVRKMSAGNLRASTRKSAEMERPPVPTLQPETSVSAAETKVKASLDTTIPQLAPVPPVPPIPIHFSKGSPSDSTGHNDGPGPYLSSPSTGSPSPASSQHKHPSVDDLIFSRPSKGPGPAPSLPDPVHQILASATTTSPSPLRSNTPKIPKAPNNKDSLSFPSTSEPTPHRSTATTPDSGRSRNVSRSASRTSSVPEVARRRSTSTKSAPPSQNDKTPARSRTQSKASQKEKARKLSISVPGANAAGPFLTVAVQGDRSRSPSVVSSAPKNAGESPSSSNQQPGKGTGHKSAPAASRSASPSAGTKGPAGQPSPAPLGVPASAQADTSPHSASYSFRTVRESARTPLSEEQKAQLWEDLLKKSEEAGGTLRPQLQFGPAA